MSAVVNELDAVLAAAVKEVADQNCLDITAYALLHGNGNVIAIVELGLTADAPLESLRQATIRLCDNRHGSTRIEGALFFYPRHHKGLRMVFFDRDGTWEAMCGNGLRCIARYAADTGLIRGHGVIVTDDGPKEVSVRGTQAQVSLGEPRQVRQLDETRWFVYTGVAHLVVFVEGARALNAVDVAAEGARLRYDRQLCASVGHPDGVHVDFAFADGDQILLRTYEVGVEDETLCCGTGVAATAHVAWLSGRAPMPVRVQTKGGPVEAAVVDGRLTIAGEVSYLVARQLFRANSRQVAWK